MSSAETPAATIERAQQLCSAAHVVREESAALVADCRRRYSERRRWRAIWNACRVSSDHIVTCCSYCARVRGPDGEWVAVPHEVSRILNVTSKIMQLSHSFCPDCIDRHFPPSVKEAMAAELR